MKKIIYLILLFIASLTPLSAREVVPLVDNWYFFPSTARTADGAQRVSLPHTWSASDTQAGVYSSIGNYTRKLSLPERWRNKRLFIKFYGVNNVANLLVNGTHAGEHKGGATAFTFEITDLLKWDGENELQLIVDGAQLSSLPPTSIDHNVECGIYREVELIVTPRAAVSPLYYGSDGVFVTTVSFSSEKAMGSVNIKLSTLTDDKMDVALTIFAEQGDTVFLQSKQGVRASQSEVTIPFTVPNPKGWSPSSPEMYRFKVEVETARMKDSVEVWSGLRVVTTDNNGRVSINSESVDVRGVLLYHDHPLVGSAIRSREIESDMELVREVGATAIRSATAPHSQALYDYCDREGVLAWVDFPISRTTFLADIGYYPTSDYHRNAELIAHEIVAQNYNHPSIIVWGLFSQLRDRGESMNQFLSSLYRSVKSVDSTRPIAATSNQNGEMNSIPDMIVWRQNLGWHRGITSDISVWSSTIHSKWSHLKSGVAYGESGSIYHQNLVRESNYTNGTSSSRSGTAQSQTAIFDRNQPDWNPEASMTKLHEEYAPRLLPDTLFWSVWLCNMFDYKSHRSESGENSSGLVTFDRRERKDIFYLYKSQWNKMEPTLHIAGRREWRREARVSDLKIYTSSADSVFVLLNGIDTLNVIPQGAGILLVNPFELNRGVNSVEVSQGELSDQIELVFEQAL